MKQSKRWKKWVVSLLAVSAMGASVCAQAADYVFEAGTLDTDTPYTQLVTHLAPIEPVGTFFMDIFNFQISDGTGTSSVAVNLALEPFFDITGLQLSLYSGEGALWSGPVGDSVTLSSNLMTNTDYYLKITGTTSGALGGAYSTAIAVLVPEADSWAMMLAGLGLVGFALRRKMDGARREQALA